MENVVMPSLLSFGPEVMVKIVIFFGNFKLISARNRLNLTELTC